MRKILKGMICKVMAAIIAVYYGRHFWSTIYKVIIGTKKFPDVSIVYTTMLGRWGLGPKITMDGWLHTIYGGLWWAVLFTAVMISLIKKGGD